MKTMKKLSNLSASIFENSRLRAVLTIALVVVMFCTLLIVNLLTPPIGDDYLYYRVCALGESFFSSVARFISYRRNMWTGRALTDFSAFVVYRLLDTVSISIIYSLSYILTAGLLYLIVRGKGKNSIGLFVGINLSLWAFVPELGQDIFWKGGAVNFLLPMLPILGMLLIYRRGYDSSGQKDGAAKCVLMALLGVISGWQLENSSIAVPFVTFVYIFLWKYKRVKVPKWAWAGFAGSVLGYILLITAPGNSHRAGFEASSASLSLPFKFAVITYYWIMFAGVLTVLFLLGAIKCRRSSPSAVIEGSVFAAAALVTAYCMIAAPSSPERTWFITISLMTAAAGIVLREAFSLDNVSRGAKIALCTAALIILGTMAADTILASYDIHEQFLQREEMILTAKENGESVVSVPVYKLKYPLRANRYALHGLYDVELGQNSQYSFNDYVAKYYGVDAIIGTNGE